MECNYPPARAESPRPSSPVQASHSLMQFSLSRQSRPQQCDDHGHPSFPTPPSHEPGMLPPHRPLEPPSYDQSVQNVLPHRNRPPSPTTRLPPLVGPNSMLASAPRLPPLESIASHSPSNTRLPGIASLGQPPAYHASDLTRDGSAPTSATSQVASSVWPITNPLTSYYPPRQRQDPQSAHTDASMRHGTASPMHSDIGSPIGARTRTNSVTLDDPKVRLACEGLQALSTNERTHSGPSSFLLSSRDPIAFPPGPSSTQDERLATFLATRSTLRPWIDRYSAGKSNWPVFRPAVELVERGVTTAVDSVPRTPFVGGLADAGVRYLLTPRRPRPSEDGDSERGAKRRRRAIGDDNGDSVDAGASAPGDRRQSSVSTMETLPAYDELSSPAYTETAMSPSSRQWAERFVISTSGLGAAVDERKLDMLRRCLSYLRQCIGLVRTRLSQLDQLLQQHEESLAIRHSYPPDVKFEAGPAIQRRHSGNIRRNIDAIWEQLRSLIQQVMNTIGQYASGALPQSASVYIRQTFLMIPENYHRRGRQEGNVNHTLPTANNDGKNEKGRVETAEFGNRVRNLAQELIESLQKVAGVMEDTALSAEGWRDSMGKRATDAQTEQASQGQQQPLETDASGDITMTK